MPRTTANVSFASIRLPNGTHNRWCPVVEAERMVERKECRRKRLPGQRHPVYFLIPQPEPLRSFNEASPPSITCTEIQIFAGLTRVSSSRAHIVRQKVKEFGKLRRRASASVSLE